MTPDPTSAFLCHRSDAGTIRDVMNEKPTNEEVAASSGSMMRRLAKIAIIHTTVGDIQIQLFGEEYVIFPLLRAL